MRAFVLREIKQPLQDEQRADLRPGPGEVVVAVKAAALNRRDYWITQGMYPGIEPPVVLGSDAAGVVVRCGEGVDPAWQQRDVLINPGLNWGERPEAQSDDFNILGLPRDGTFATEVLVPAQQLHDKPAYLSWEQAAALPLAGVTACRAVFTKGGLTSGQTVLITGIGGGVATFALQLAVAVGAEAWVTSSSPDKIQRAVDLGARGGALYTDDDWDRQLRDQGVVPQLIVDSAGGDSYGALVNLVAPGGRIVNYGATAGPPPKFDLFKVFWKQLHLQGSTMGSPNDFQSLLAISLQHELAPVIDRVMPLEQVNDALQLMASSPQFGKLVLSVASS